MTREEMQDEKIENEAMKSAKETLKKKTKNKVTKIIWNAVKAVVIPMLIFALKIMAVAILIIIAISLFNNVLDGNNGSTSTDEEYSSYIEDSISGGADITADQWLFTETQVEDFIINYNSENVSLKNQMLNNIRRIQEWQADYGYSAGLLITMAFEENVSDFDEFLEDMNYIAQSWKDNEYTTINQIAQDYVGDETTSEWANNITNKLHETGRNAEIITEGEETTEVGDGYVGTFTNRTGKTFYNYKQYKGSYAQYMWVSGALNTIYNNGCALTSAATIISGYLGTLKSPIAIVQEQAPNGSYFTSAPSPTSYFLYYGINASRPFQHHYTELTSTQKQDIIDNLINGKPVIIYVLGYNGVQVWNGQQYVTHRGNSQFTTTQHWMALLDYNKADNTIYVSNPSDIGGTGWINAQTVLTSCTEYILINN